MKDKLSLISLASMFFVYPIISKIFAKNYETVIIEFNGSDKKVSINAQVADNFFKKSLGLMYRETIREEEGMLFLFKRERKPRFWMKNMKFPIDVIFVSGDFKIVDIIENTQPNNSLFCFGFKPKRPAKYVVETKAGFCKKHGIKIGDNVKIY
jgi:uncharacterized membrane protein (UPF0127 family)